MPTICRFAVAVLVASLLLTTPSSGQVTTTATMSVSIEVSGVGGAPPYLDVLGATSLDLTITERSCGGPTFLLGFVTGSAPVLAGPDAGSVTIVDAEPFRADVQVPATIDGTACEYTVDPTESLLCYETVDVVADPAGSALVLNAAGVPTGDALSPAEGAVVEVIGSYLDACAELRLVVEGLGDRELVGVIDFSPLDVTDVARTCDYGDVNITPGRIDHVDGVVVRDSAPTPCSVTISSLSAEGCTITPSTDSFTMEQPEVERRFVATCAQVPPPVVEEPTFTG